MKLQTGRSRNRPKSEGISRLFQIFIVAPGVLAAWANGAGWGGEGEGGAGAGGRGAGGGGGAGGTRVTQIRRGGNVIAGRLERALPLL